MASSPSTVPSDLSPELSKRIKLVRRDLGRLLFHFTRKPKEDFVSVEMPYGGVRSWPASAGAVLRKILHQGALTGTSRWSAGGPCVCFTEAPIEEFNALFSLNAIASQEHEKPRYEPYGIAVSKEWLFERGGRPVIYDTCEIGARLHESDRYRLVEYDFKKQVDYTWEREWRIQIERLVLDPAETLVIVPSSTEAFDIVYDFAKLETDYDDQGPVGAFHEPRWLAVSLDLFGFSY